ncbi:MAG: RNA chaperone Hfq [Pseudomonadota bacterium]
MNSAIQDNFLNKLREERVPVSIFLGSGIKLVGKINEFDENVILFKHDKLQMIYKNAIATIMPEQKERPLDF